MSRPLPAGDRALHIPGHTLRRASLTRGICAASLALLCTWWSPSSSQILQRNAYIVDGDVRALAIADNTLYVGGVFSRVGPATGGGAPLDPVSGALLGNDAPVSGFVFAAVSDGAGGWYIGGDFAAVGGEARSNIAHIGSDLRVTPWNPEVNGLVYDLAFADGIVYVVGSFDRVSGVERFNLAAVDGATGAATPWNPNPILLPGVTNTYRHLAIANGMLYVAGSFSTIGSTARRNLAAIDLVTGTVTAWDPSPAFEVRAIATLASAVYVSLGTAVAAYDSPSGQALLWIVLANGTVRALAAQGATIYAGGDFTFIGGANRNRLAALDAATCQATSWDPNANWYVTSLAISGSTVYAGGDFSVVGGILRSKFAAMDAATGAVTAWNPNVAGGVLTSTVLAPGESGIYAGGSFKMVGGVSRRNLAAINLTTGLPTDWNPSPGGVNAIAIDGPIVYVGGILATIPGQPVTHLRAIDRATGAISNWNPRVSGEVTDVAVDAGTVYAVGKFTSLGGQTRLRIGAVDAVTGSATAFNPGSGFLAALNCLAKTPSRVYAGGRFMGPMGGQNVGALAALDPLTGQATVWNPGFGSLEVYDLLVEDPAVYAVGNFSTLGGEPRNHVAAVGTVSGLATVWDPNADKPVHSIARDESAIYVGGEFTTIGGLARSHIASIDPSTGVPTEWNPGAGGVTVTAPPMLYSVNVIATDGPWVCMGGRFDVVDNLPQANLAVFSTQAPEPLLASIDVDPNVINLKSHAPWITVYVESEVFDPSEIDIASVLLEGEIPPVARFAVIGDHDGDQQPDLMLKFEREQLDPLLSTRVNALELRGSLSDGREFRGADDVTVIHPPAAPLEASVAPNPMNPSAVLTFSISNAGPVTIHMFDVRGRVVRSLMESRALPAGRHRLVIDGRTDQGVPLRSGVYFYRVVTADGVVTGRVAVVR